MLDGDCHVLVPSRDKDTISRFLNTFLPNRECATGGWIVEENTEREREITDENELIEFCIKHPTADHAIYWHGRKENSGCCAWVFFTDDGATIFGLTCFEETDAEENELLEKLKRHTGSEIGYISYVTPPPYSASRYIHIFNGIN